MIFRFPARTNLFDSGQGSRRVYLLRAGRVRLSSGREAILDYLTPGAFFGEECLLEPRRRSQSARSLSPVTVAAFGPSQLLDRVQHDRRFTRRLLKNLALRLSRCGEQIQDFVIEPAERRLALLLSRFAPMTAASGWVRLRFSPSNSDLAKAIGTTRWRISYFMRHFQGLGWLERRPELWVRRDGLREFLEQTK